MSEAVVDDIVAVLPPLLQSLEALGFVARYLNPPDFGSVMEAAGEPDAALRAARPRLATWPVEFGGIKNALEAASDTALAAQLALTLNLPVPSHRGVIPVSTELLFKGPIGVSAGGQEEVRCRRRASPMSRAREPPFGSLV